MIKSLSYGRAIVVLMIMLAGLLLHPEESQAQETDVQTNKIIITANALLAGVDGLQTSYCLGKGICREANPFLKNLIEKHGVVPALSTKLAMHTGITVLLLKKNQSHPKIVKWSGLILLGAQTYVDIHNYRAVRRNSR